MKRCQLFDVVLVPSKLITIYDVQFISPKYDESHRFECRRVSTTIG